MYISGEQSITTNNYFFKLLATKNGIQKLKVNLATKEQTIMWQKQLKTTLQDVLGQLLKYGVASSRLTPTILCARTRSRSLATRIPIAHWHIYTAHNNVTIRFRFINQIC